MKFRSVSPRKGAILIFIAIAGVGLINAGALYYYCRQEKDEDARSRSKVLRLVRMIELINSVPSEHQLDQFKAESDGYYTTSSSVAIPPTKAGAEYAEDNYVPAGTLGLPPFELIFNKGGKVLAVRSTLNTETSEKNLSEPNQERWFSRWLVIGSLVPTGLSAFAVMYFYFARRGEKELGVGSGTRGN